MNAKFDSMGVKIDGMGTKIDNMGAKFEAKFDIMEAKVLELHREIFRSHEIGAERSEYLSKCTTNEICNNANDGTVHAASFEDS